MKSKKAGNIVAICLGGAGLLLSAAALTISIIALVRSTKRAY